MNCSILSRRARSLGVLALLTTSVAIALAAVAPSADAAGGANIASAPIVPFGVHEFGTTATGEYDCGPGEYWNVVLQPSDQITVDWETTNRDYAYELVVYPAGTTDFSINNVEALDRYELGGNDKAEAVFSSGTGGTFPIVFAAVGCDDAHNAGPYDFTISRQQAILVNLAAHENLNTNTTLTATATFVNGQPVPDGLSFTLEATWSGERAIYTATSSGGGLSFPLALPEAAIGETASFVVTRPADSQYQEVKSGILESNVAKAYVPPPPPPAPPPAPSACQLAREHAHVLARQYRRLSRHLEVSRRHSRHSRRARHNSRRIARHTARVERQFRAARARAGALCK